MIRRFVVLLALFSTTAWAGVNQWTITGPPVSVSAMAVDNANVLYAAGYDVFARSTDRGATWTTTATSISQPTELRVAASTPATLFLLGFNELYRSLDGGMTWVKRTIPSPAQFTHDIEVDPNNAAVIILGATNFCFGTCTGGGVYRSTDGGGSWNRIGLKDTAVLDVAFNGSAIYAVSDAKLYRTTNGGRDWTNVSPAPAVKTIAIDAVLPSTIYSAADGGVFRSDDAGARWTLIRASEFGGMLATSPHGLLTSATGAALTLDHGDTWRELPGASQLDVRHLWQLAVTSDTCYMLTDLGNASGQILAYEVRWPRRRAVR